ncbi:MerR family transcriptional regulator [Spirillospora sp. NPDC047279]|uniref:MerR family transcriptional regulator n=1 Tax=Spirillospora sp. NPDC047279 TaxID=3155478 RepID=UPI0033F526B1
MDTMRTSGDAGGPGGAVAGLRSGQVAAAAGVNPQTLRYYERRGLLAEPRRTLGGHRVYPPETVAWLRGVKAAQRLGFTLDEVAGLSAGRPGVHDRARAKLAEVEAKIADLNAVAATLRAALDAGCDDLETCARAPECPLPFGGEPVA